MLTRRLVLPLSLSALLTLATLSVPANAATLMLAEEAEKVASLRNIEVKDGGVTLEVVNNSKQTLREVQLQILYSWRWQDEFHPGADDPGRVVYEMINAEIAPGQSARFTYKPSPPLPARSDGSFAVSVKVVGFARVYL